MPALARLNRRQALASLLGASTAPLLFGGCSDFNDYPAPTPRMVELPAAGLPRSMREWNWGSGSCVFCSWLHTERRVNLQDLATYIRTHYSGGESYNGLTSKMRKLGVPFYSCVNGRSDADVAASIPAWLLNGKWFGTFRGDVDVLERCTAERRMAIIFYFNSHSINFCGFQGDTAYVLDNNRIEDYLPIPKDTFIRNWRNRYGGVAVVPAHSEPPPPIPYIA